MLTSWNWERQEFKCAQLLTPDDGEAVSDRQDRVAGFDTAALSGSRILLSGGGGLGSQIATGLARKGVGHVDICDNDVVEPSNLNRQFFYEGDLYEPKAVCLARNAAREGHLGGQVVGHYVAFDDSTANDLLVGASIVICAGDNNATRAVTSRVCGHQGIPVVFTAVDERADYGWVYIQEGRTPCLGCVFPRVASAGSLREPCRATPAVLDILRVVGGIVLYSVDSLLMDRPRNWTFRSVSLIGGVPDAMATIEPRRGCPLCSLAAEANDHGPTD